MVALIRRLARERPRALGLAVVIGVFACSRVALWSTGGRFSTGYLGWQLQLLDAGELAAHPLGSVWHLHTQPPLFNLLVGVVLRWSPLPAGLSLQIVYVAFGLVLAVASYRLALDLRAPVTLAAIAASAVVLNPVLLGYENALSYELPTAMLLVLAARAFARFARTGATGAFALLVTWSTLVVLTRALLHPTWLAGVLAFALVIRRPRAGWRPIAAWCVLPIVLVGGWMVKNAVLFDEATLSSWFGMNLQRAVVSPLTERDLRELVREGRLSRVSTVGTFGSYALYEPFTEPCRPSSDRPVLAAPDKSNGLPNFNYECFLPVYAQSQRDALEALRARPGRYVAIRPVTLARYLEPAEAPVTPSSDVLRGLNWVFDRLTLQRTITIDMRDWAFPLLLDEGFPTHPSLVLSGALIIVLARGALALVRLVRRREFDDDPTWVFLFWTVGAVTAVSILFELGENDRFRVIVDPLLIVGSLSAVGTWVSSHTGARQRSVEVEASVPA